MNSNYVNAPTTKMLASHCAVCARPLCDAKSVELGIGPDCRAKYGFDSLVTEEQRKAANALVHKIAMVQKGTEAFEACKALHELGFAALAARIMERLTKIVIEAVDDGEKLAVWTPYEVNFVAAVQKVPGRVWDKARKCSLIPATIDARRALQKALNEHFAGKWAVGPRGPFVVGEVAK